jgi:hypothetical protein
MSLHLPECYAIRDRLNIVVCTCNELRAAEQRGREHQFSAAQAVVDEDGTARMIYADDCPQLLVSRELMDMLVADYNERRELARKRAMRPAVPPPNPALAITPDDVLKAVE